MIPFRFRAWDKERNQFAKMATILFRPETGGYVLGNCDKDRLIIQLNTGLKDVNGKDIYEGDIVTHDFPNEVENPFALVPTFKEVVFEDAQFKIKGELRGWPPLNRWEVAGNIFENSGLLK